MNTVPTVSDTKRAFLQSFPKPIKSVYRRVVDELLVELHLLIVDRTYRYSPLLGLGIVSAFDRFMVGYTPEADRQKIFSALCQSLHYDPAHLRQEAEQLTELSVRSPESILSVLTTLESSNGDLDQFTQQVREIASTQPYKYSRLLAIGIFVLLEATTADFWQQAETRQTQLKQIGDTLKFGGDRLIRDADLFRSNIEKVEQARQMMQDMVEAERKKRAAVEPTSVETTQAP
ncbi:MAG: photosystem II biogenesis protein Psp29 [Oscillatoriales cyanobacterium SM2_2_1]|nr:photosystem II biogenesis protein Psp29 [Oscillatoriales cyanobacterium SM2_2_1]